MLRRWLTHAGAGEMEIAEITTACGEAATNSIEHGGASGDASFEVSGSHNGGQIEIAVRDHGSWRPDASGRPRPGPRPHAHSDGYGVGEPH